jgi:NAD(P)-dependent dehydrogenase (short-subunit alcohol dehydrogenase family)
LNGVFELFNLEGRVAIVTGAGTGLGRQMANGLASAGADIVLVGRRLGHLQETVEEIRGLGRKALAVTADITEPDQIKEMMDQVMANFNRLDILVNNAGMTHVEPVTDLSLQSWQTVLNTNVTGMFLCAQAVGKVMIPQQKGKIINISSVYGSVGIDASLYEMPGKPTLEALPYSTSKGAVRNMTRDLACNWARYGINVNSISPGMFITYQGRGISREEVLNRLIERTPLKRHGNDQDLKGAVVYLASNASDFVTGHDLVVDGGWTAW